MLSSHKASRSSDIPGEIEIDAKKKDGTFLPVLPHIAALKYHSSLALIPPREAQGVAPCQRYCSGHPCLCLVEAIPVPEHTKPIPDIPDLCRCCKNGEEEP